MAITDTHTDDLFDALAGDEPDYDTEPDTPPGVDAAKDQAGKWLWHLARLDREKADVVARARAERDRINAWESRRLEQLDGQRSWFERGLEQITRMLRSIDPKKASWQLPAGKLKSTAQQPVWDIDDEPFLAWADDHRPELVNQPDPPAPKPAKGEAKKVLVVPGLDTALPGQVLAAVDPVTGQPVPGVTVTVRDRRYDAVPNTEEHDEESADV